MTSQQPPEGLSAELDMIACELRRWSLKSAPDGFRLFRDETRMEGPWSFAEADLAEQRMSEAQAAAVQIIVDADLRTVLSALAEARSEVERVTRQLDAIGANWMAARARADTLAAQLVGAREALEPFAKLADYFDAAKAPMPDTVSLNNGMTLGDCRRARQALSMSILRGDKGCFGAEEAPSGGSPADSQPSGGAE